MIPRIAFRLRIKALLAALTLSAGLGMTAPALAQDKLTFLTSWYAQAEHGGFYQALATGLYKKYGLDVTIRMGGPQVNGLQLLAAGQVSGDRAWQMPLWDDYQPQLKSNFADMSNLGGPAAGSITAALFLRRFVDCPRYLHFDLYCHQKADAPARPKGGVGQGARAVLAALPSVLGL